MAESMSPPPEAAPVSGTPAAAVARPDSIYLVSYPKIVFLYPTLLAALAAGGYMAATGNADTETAHVVNLIFLGVLALNLVVFAFDFPRTTSLTLFFFIVAVVVAGWAVVRLNPGILPAALKFLTAMNPLANSTFYFMFAGVVALIYVGVAISTRFDYWEVRPNELLHHHGFLSDMKRYPAPHLRIDKEINDVFEYLLLRSGRLILHPNQERQAIVLDNVFFIDRKEDEITRLLGALQVQVRHESNH